MVAVWINLHLKYKEVEYCENILSEYILYNEQIKDYLRVIEMGSLFRNQCLLHIFPFEVRKKIYETVVKRFCGGHLLECKTVAKRIFP